MHACHDQRQTEGVFCWLQHLYKIQPCVAGHNLSTALKVSFSMRTMLTQYTTNLVYRTSFSVCDILGTGHQTSNLGAVMLQEPTNLHSCSTPVVFAASCEVWNPY